MCQCDVIMINYDTARGGSKGSFWQINKFVFYELTEDYEQIFNEIVVKYWWFLCY